MNGSDTSLWRAYGPIRIFSLEGGLVLHGNPPHKLIPVPKLRVLAHQFLLFVDSLDSCTEPFVFRLQSANLAKELIHKVLRHPVYY